MVIFCTKYEGQSIKFRNPTLRDLLNSPSREAFLLPEHEVTEEDFKLAGEEKEGEEVGVLRRNDTAKLVKWHESSAMGHWHIMRKVLPEVVWEGW